MLKTAWFFLLINELMHSKYFDLTATTYVLSMSGMIRNITLAHGSSARKTALSSQQLQGVKHDAPPRGGGRGDSPGCVPV